VATRTDLRVALGPVGIWASLDAIPIGEVLDFASAVEDLAFDIGLVRGARETLDAAAAGAGQPGRPVLVVSQPAILGGGPAVRHVARGLVMRYLGQPNYRADLRRGDYTEEALDAVSDPLVDALVATGDAAALRARVTSLGEAGADHVAVIPLSAAGRQASLETAAAVAPDPREWAGPGVANARPAL
jgi:hypothetical protein